MITIYHTADIHIINDIKNKEEYYKVFTNLYNLISKEVNDFILVVCGDVFHTSSITGLHIALFNEFIKVCEISNLTELVIIPGNHDKNNVITELITGLKYQNKIKHLNEGEYYYKKEYDLIFYNNFINGIITDNKGESLSINKITNRIQLLHKYISNEKELKLISKYLPRIILAGDKHERSFISYKRELNEDTKENNSESEVLFYSGSLIQQNIYESSDKGIYKHEIGDTISSNFIKIPNEYVKLKINLSGIKPKLEEIKNCLRIIKSGNSKKIITQLMFIVPVSYTTELSNEIIVYAKEYYSCDNVYYKYDNENIIENENTGNNERTDDSNTKKTKSKKIKSQKLASTFENTTKNTESSNTKSSFVYINDEKLSLVGNIIKSKLEESDNIPIQLKSSIMVLHKKYESMNKRKGSIKLLELCFDNMFCYGEECYLSFDQMKGIIGIISNNKTGKSSLLDIILFALYNEVIRGDTSEVMNNNSNYYRFSLKFSCNGIIYCIERYTIGTATKIKLYNFTTKEIYNQNGLKEVYDLLKSIIGTYEEFLMTTMQAQDFSSEYDIVNKSAMQRYKIIGSIVGISDTKFINTTIKKKIGDLKKQLEGIKIPDRSENEINNFETKINKLKEKKEENNKKYFTLDNNLKEYNNSNINNNINININNNNNNVSNSSILIGYNFPVVSLSNSYHIKNFIDCLLSDSEFKQVFLQLKYIKDNINFVETNNYNFILNEFERVRSDKLFLETKNDKYASRISNIKKEIKCLTTELENTKSFNESENKKLNDKLTIFEHYFSLLEIDKIESRIMEIQVNEIVKKMNEILKTLNCDFELLSRITNCTIKLTIRSAKYGDISVGRGSGFQKFVIGLAFRLTVSGLMFSQNEFIIIDEGFGCLDNENLELVSKFLTRLEHKFIIVVSHLPKLNECVSDRIMINIGTLKNKVSYKHESKSIEYTFANEHKNKSNDSTNVNVKVKSVYSCECGSELTNPTKTALEAHKKTKKHTNYITNKNK